MELNIWVAVYLTILMIVLCGIGYVGDAIRKARGGSAPAPKTEDKPSDES